MNNRDQNMPRQQGPETDRPGGQQDMPRQSDQWQASPSRQAGSPWEYDDNRTGSYSYGRAAVGMKPDSVRDRNEGYARNDERYRRDPRYDQQRGERGASAYQTGYPDRYYYSGSRGDFADFTSEDYGGRDFSGAYSGPGGGMRPSDTYRPSYGLSSHGGDYGGWRQYGESRGFLEKAGDEIASWFGDEDAAKRREMDHRGRGPSDYTRSDERIREDVNDNLTQDWRVDASHVRVTVTDGEVTLDGHVDSRQAKRRAEDIADDVTGVKHVQNNLRIQSASGATVSAPYTTKTD